MNPGVFKFRGKINLPDIFRTKPLLPTFAPWHWDPGHELLPGVIDGHYFAQPAPVVVFKMADFHDLRIRSQKRE